VNDHIDRDYPAFQRQCLELYTKALQEDVVPFWMRHALDPKAGTINNCLADDGTLLSTDKFLWSQGRALWTFSALYNRIEPRRDWLEVAHGLRRYLSTYGRDEKGRYMYRLDAEGNIIERDISIYVDGFVLNGLGEYYTATGDHEAASLALEISRNVIGRLRTRSYNIAPYALPEDMKALGIPMIFSFFLHNLGKAVCSNEMMEIGHAFALEVLRDFYVPQKDAILEFVGFDGPMMQVPKGRVCVPGHVIEACWFLISIFEDSGDIELIPECCRLIIRHLELGWDEEFGGIRLAVDIDGREPAEWHKPDYKPWWPQVEALIATAYAYLHTRDTSFLDWHRRIRDYAYAHYPVPTGEWTQWLDRRGNKTESAGLPVKDPFHLPRGLIYLISLFGRITDQP
jgi:N-acylglucosamine 2-epimerase